MLFTGRVVSLDKEVGHGIIQHGPRKILFYVKDGRLSSRDKSDAHVFTEEKVTRQPQIGENLICLWPSEHSHVTRWTFTQRKTLVQRPVSTSPRRHLEHLFKKRKRQKQTHSRQPRKITWEESEDAILEVENIVSAIQVLSKQDENTRQMVVVLTREDIRTALHFFRKYLQAQGLTLLTAQGLPQYRDIAVRLLTISGDRENIIDAIAMLGAIKRGQRTKHDRLLFYLAKEQLKDQSSVGRSKLFKDLPVHTATGIDHTARRVGKHDSRRTK